MSGSEYDYVVIGGGSSGSIVASRLAAADAMVLLLEAGTNDGHDVNVAIPAQIGHIYFRRNWNYKGVADPTREGKIQDWSAGKGLGGGGSINSTVFVRGNRGDYDSWAAGGATGWDYDCVLPAFRRMETWRGGASAFRGGDGPIAVDYHHLSHPTIGAFLEGARQAGHPYNEDYNGERQEGVANSQSNQRRGLRSHASREYVRGVAPRKNLTVRTGAFVHRILFEGRRAVGVEYEHGSRLSVVRPSGEIILSAGAIASPKILMLSGVGPKSELTEHGIPVVLDSPGVGQGLQDHCSVPMHFRTPHRTVNALRPWDLPKIVADYALRGAGPLSTTMMQTQLFQRLDPTAVSPDLQTSLCSFAVTRRTDGKGRNSVALAKASGIHIWTIMLHPTARGAIRLRSARPTDSPVIDHQLLPPDDLRFMLNGLDNTLELTAQPALAAVLGDRFEAEAACRTKADWTAWLRRTATYGLHVVGTCRVGTDDGAVVDPELRVHGLTGLRVVDASIMPTMPSGNTNAPAMMLGERGAEFLLR